MNPGWEREVAGVPVLVATGHCLGCGKALVLIQLPQSRIAHEDAVCFACRPRLPRRHA